MWQINLMSRPCGKCCPSDHTHTRTHTHTFARAHTHAHAPPHTHTHTHIHTYIHTHTHTLDSVSTRWITLQLEWLFSYSVGVPQMLISVGFITVARTKKWVMCWFPVAPSRRMYLSGVCGEIYRAWVARSAFSSKFGSFSALYETLPQITKFIRTNDWLCRNFLSMNFVWW